MADQPIPENTEWVIYELHRPGGQIFYVGATVNLKRRLKEHRIVYGGDVIAEILKRGSGPGRNEAEHWWIERFRAAGYKLENKTDGGNGLQTTSSETRAKLSRINKGKKLSPEHREKIGLAHRGKPKNWSAEGAERRQETQYKKGHKNTPEQLAAVKKAIRKYWDAIPPETRTQMASEMNIRSWANPDVRARRVEGMKQAHARKTPEQRSAITKNAGIATARKHPNAMSSRIRNWWANLTPEQKQAEIDRRRETRRRNRKMRANAEREK